MHKPGYKETNIMKKKKSKKKIIIGAAAVLVVAGGVTVAGQRNSTENQIPQVQVVIAEKGDVEEIVDATGTVGSEEEKTYYSPVNAELKTVSFAQGDVVKKGTKLIEFNTEDLEKDNRKAELNLKSTKYDTKDTRNKSDKAEKKQKDAKKNVQELEKKIKDKKAYVSSLKSQISAAAAAAQREAVAQATAQAAAQAKTGPKTLHARSRAARRIKMPSCAATMASNEKLRSTRCRPALPNLSPCAGSASSAAQLSAKAALSPTGESRPLSPRVTSRGMPPVSVAHTGRPAAMASRITLGWPSRTEVSAKMRAAA